MKTTNAVSTMSLLFAVAAMQSAAATYQASTKEELISLLKEQNGKSNIVIELAAGDYSLTDEEAWFTSTSIWKSHLFSDKVRIKGMGVKPEDTRLIGSGNMRVIQQTNGATIENLTVTNGHAQTVSGYDNSARGGGVYGGVVTNCLITGNRAETYGGGGAGSVRFWKSRIIANHAKFGGGFHYSYAYSCRIADNRSYSNGGGCFTANELKDSEIVNNAVTNSGGGGGCWFCTYGTNNVFAGNVATGSGGGVAGNSGTGRIVDCVISNNVASNGGGVYSITVDTCVVTMNRSTGTGGGVSAGAVFNSWVGLNTACGDGGGIRNATVVSNCVVYGNYITNLTANCFGAGIKGDGSGNGANYCRVYDTEIFGNASEDLVINGTRCYGSGGGVMNVEARNCSIHDNYATSYGGGMRESRAYGCRIWNNISYNYGPNSMGCQLIGCDVSGTPIYGGSGFNTVIHDIGPAPVELVGNPLISTNLTPTSCWHGYPVATNCLIANVHAPQNVLFSGVFSNPSTESALVNCTVVGCSFRRVFACYAVAAKPMNVVNCLFYGNRQYTTVADWQNGTPIDCDFSIDTGNVNSSALHFSHVAYGTSGVSSFADYVTDSVYKFGAADGVGTVIAATPGFCGTAKDPGHPYALRHSSEARGRGVVQGWMASATDLRGEGFPRLREGLVDLGCYQCWLPPVGTWMILR